MQDTNSLLIIHSPEYLGKSLKPYYQGHMVPTDYFQLFILMYEKPGNQTIPNQSALVSFIHALNTLGLFKKTSCHRNYKEWQSLANRKGHEILQVEFPIRKESKERHIQKQYEIELQDCM